MRCFHTTTYDLYNKNSIKIFIMNDIHFSRCVKDKKLKYIVNYINKEQPNYILIPGDLIDSVDDIKETFERNRIVNFLKEISKYSKVLISLGNHDMFIRKDGKRWLNIDYDFLNELNSTDNIYVLDNKVYEDDMVYICGITQTFKYYFKNDIDILINDLDKNKDIIYPDNEKIKIIMIHSPINLEKQIIKDKLINFDYIICGHMHNGCVPPILNEIWRSTRGIVDPNKKFLKKYERNTLRRKEDKLLVNGPVTTFQHIAGFFKVFNFIFPTYISIMKFNENNNFKITKKYHKFK